MMISQTIVPFGDPILRKKAKPVTEFNPKLAKLLDGMGEMLYAREGRAGLAAPQVGILKRVVVLDCGEGLIELINPEITESGGEQSAPEACLSFPGYFGIVRRANYVKVKSLDRNGEAFTLEGEGLLARCLQHELDHLDGVLFIDYVREPVLYHEHTKQTIDLLDVIRLSRHGTV
jgi:peptide deformylase